eukprot:COSAG01_NODE_40582_length_462_cov_0.556474_1_plen_32_part_10
MSTVADIVARCSAVLSALWATEGAEPSFTQPV